MIEKEAAIKLKLDDIPEEGLTLVEDLDPRRLELETPHLTWEPPVSVRADFHKDRDVVVVAAQVEGKTTLICDRCLEPYSKDYRERFDLGFDVKGKLALDITDDLRQEILLSYPVRTLCRESCKGLCPQCGANLNRESQHCLRKE